MKTRTDDLPACRIVPQPTTLPRQNYTRYCEFDEMCQKVYVVFKNEVKFEIWVSVRNLNMDLK
jgi:hypothetical protein